MPTRIRTRLSVDATLRSRGQCARLGADVRAGRVARRWTQAQLGRRVGLGRQTISRAERGLGAGLTLDAWQRIGLALDRPLAVALQRDPATDVADAGHLAIQELVLRLGRAAGYRGAFELATRPAQPWRSVDVGLEDPARGTLVLVECWNTFGDLGAAARSSSRKLAELAALAVARHGAAPARVGLLWVVRATAGNRRLVSRYPEVFAARFPGSSRQWVHALVEGSAPPPEPGLAWCDIHATRLFAWQRRARVVAWPGAGAGGSAGRGLDEGRTLRGTAEGGR